jgi:hypothetical protein
MSERVWRGAVDRTGWDAGPWDDEPDKVQWIDEATGLDCLAVRNRHGSWCGYVGVPVGHRLHGVRYQDLDFEPEVHGGLTFSDKCMEGAPEGAGVCHVPEPGRPADIWWLGFDCGHFMDLSPGIDALLRQVRRDRPPDPKLEELEARMREMDPHGLFADTYRDLAYVRAEVARLAEQVA